MNRSKTKRERACNKIIDILHEEGFSATEMFAVLESIKSLILMTAILDEVDKKMLTAPKG